MTEHEPPHSARPIPDTADPLWREHFTGLRERRLLVQRCGDCGTSRWPPRELCPNCRSGEAEWQAAATTGVVYTYTVVHRAFAGFFASRVPYGVASVDLDAPDGVRFLAPCFGANVAALQCGAQMRLEFERVHDDLTLPHWFTNG